jgi:hypothetical protein
MPTIEEMRRELASRSTPSVEEMRRQLSGGSAAADEIVQETHPDFGWADRFAIKNFGGSPETIDAYIDKQGFKTKTSNGQRLIKKENDSKWHVLDPDTGFLSSDMVGDFMDVIASDIPKAVGSGLATAAGGIAGGAATGGAGAIPGAMLAGGASSAALEGLRQAVGNYIGTAEGVDATDIGIDAGIGAFAPLIGGTGGAKAVAKNIAGTDILSKLGFGGTKAVEKYLGKEGLKGLGATSVEGINAALEKATASQSGLVAKLGPKALAAATGVPEEAIRAAPGKVSSTIQGLLGVESKKPMTNMQIAELIHSQGGADAISAVREQAVNAAQEVTDGLQKRVGDSLKQVGAEYDLAKYTTLLTEERDKLLLSGNKNAGKAAKEIEDLIEDYFVVGADTVPAEQMMLIKNQLADEAGFLARSATKPTDSTKEKAARKVWKSMTDDIWSDVKQADKMLGQKGDLQSLYKDNENMKRYILPKIKNEDATEATLKKVGSPAPRRNFKQQVKVFDKKYGTNIKDIADILEVEKYLADPGLMAGWGGGASATARTLTAGALGGTAGSYLGYEAGGTQGRMLGGLTGGLMGGVLGSPLMLKQAIKAAPIADYIRSLSDYGMRYGAPNAATNFRRADK